MQNFHQIFSPISRAAADQETVAAGGIGVLQAAAQYPFPCFEAFFGPLGHFFFQYSLNVCTQHRWHYRLGIDVLQVFRVCIPLL